MYETNCLIEAKTSNLRNALFQKCLHDMT